MFTNIAHAAETPSMQQGFMQFVPFVLIFVVFYFMIIRPEKKRQQKHKDMVENAKKGEKVITTSGILGTIKNIKEDIVSIEIAENVQIDIMKTAISTIIEDEKKKAKTSAKKEK